MGLHVQADANGVTLLVQVGPNAIPFPFTAENAKQLAGGIYQAAEKSIELQAKLAEAAAQNIETEPAADGATPPINVALDALNGAENDGWGDDEADDAVPEPADAVPQGE